MKNNISNFIPLSRKLFKHEFWEEKRTYSRFEAWLDLIASARFDCGEGRRLAGGHVVRWQRGEVLASIRFLSERWNWTKYKADSFIRMLKAEKMITTRTPDGTKQTVITICNYHIYNPVSNINAHQARQTPDVERTPAGQTPDETNKENKEQKSKERKIYRSFAHLFLLEEEFLKLNEAGYSKKQIDQILDEIENYKNNKKYTSLFLTAKKWLAAGYAAASKNLPGGRVTGIANAFQSALQHTQQAQYQPPPGTQPPLRRGSIDWQ